MRPCFDGASVRRPRGSHGVILRSRAIYSSSLCNEVCHCVKMLLGCCKDALFFLLTELSLLLKGCVFVVNTRFIHVFLF